MQFHFIINNLATKLFFLTQFVLCIFPNLGYKTFKDRIFYLKVWYNLNRKLHIILVRVDGLIITRTRLQQATRELDTVTVLGF